MTTYKLTAPNDVTCRIGGHLDYFWMISGVAYTDREDIARGLGDRGYTVTTAASVPAEYQAKVARLEAWPWPITVGQADGADPAHKYRFTDPSGNWHDVRDLLSGALTAVQHHNPNIGLVAHLDSAIAR